MRLEWGTQEAIRRLTGLSKGYLSRLIRTEQRPSWTTARRLAIATNTWPELWLEGDANMIFEELSKNTSVIRNKIKPSQNLPA